MATLPDLSGLPPELLQELLFGGDRLKILREQKRPIGQHLADYRAHMEAKPVKPKHLIDTTRRVRLLVRLCRARTFADLGTAQIRVALSKLAVARSRRLPLSIATRNHYLTSLKGFCNWMVEVDRAERSPCRAIKPLPKLEAKHARRALAHGELMRLIDAAHAGPAIAGIPGEERALTYILAATTGLRVGELQKLTRASFILDGTTPTVKLGAAHTKNRKSASIPLRADVAVLVKAYLAGIDRDRVQKLFRLPANTTYALRKDLAAAGIEYVVNGEYADNHAQRHTFVSNLFSTGSQAKETQTLARHQDARLTLGRYAHVEDAALRAAVERLPSLGCRPARRETNQSPAVEPLG